MSGHPPGKDPIQRSERKPREVAFGRKAMSTLKVLPLLLLFHMQLSKAFPVSSQPEEEKDIEVVQVN